SGGGGAVSEARTIPLTYTLQEAAQKLGVSEKTLRLELRAGNLRCVIIGARRRFTDRDLEEFLERKRMVCPSNVARGRPTGTTTSRSKVIGFAEAVTQTTRKRRRQ